VDLFSFDATYVERLAAGDSAIVEHFNAYFGELISIKLRARQYSAHTIDDIRQETFLRVFQALRRDGIRQPERIGAFVNSVCNNIMLEFGRAGARITFTDETPEPPDASVSSENALIDRERRERVRQALAKMPEKHRKLLRAIFVEERSPEEVCDEMGIDRGYLRVLLFRARTQLKEAVRKDDAPKRANGHP
jgi:RNA polymerase sigma-70 factor (ECF subfamily)